MGQYIHVNLDALSDAAAKIDTYRRDRSGLISQMSDQLHSSEGAWSAEDHSAFIAEWDMLRATDGALTLIDKQLEYYHDVLDAAYTAYKKAQQASAEQAEEITSWTMC